MHEWIGALFLAKGGLRAMAGIDDRIIRELRQAGQGFRHQLFIASLQIRATHCAEEERIPAEEGFFGWKIETHSTG